MSFSGFKGWLIGAAALFGASFVSGHASADEPATANVFQLGLGFRYGINLESGDLNPWGPGIGISAGYTLPNALYLGGDFDYFFGQKKNVAPGVDAEGHVLQFMAEGGYDFGVTRNIVLRPKLGIGYASLTGKACVDGFGCAESTDSSLALAPGGTFLLLTEHFSLTLDARYDRVFTDPKGSALLFSVGIGF